MLLNVIYMHHSGVLVETKNYCLIFDYYIENGQGYILDIEKYKNKKIFVFVSHFHSDHFDKAIFNWNSLNLDIKYILSDDIKLKDKNDNIFMVHFWNKYKFDDIDIITLHSNDSGVAFLVKVENNVIYHSGDLNWWNWNGESEQFNKSMEGMYKKELETLKNEKIDVAFIPLDPRLEENYILGMDYFIRNVDVKKVFPIHFWNNFNIYDTMLADKRSKDYRNKVVKISKKGQVFNI